jgi:predicted nucleotide-binding protein
VPAAVAAVKPGPEAQPETAATRESKRADSVAPVAKVAAGQAAAAAAESAQRARAEPRVAATASAQVPAAAPAQIQPTRPRVFVPHPHETVARLRTLLQQRNLALKVVFDGPAWLLDADVPGNRRAELAASLADLGLTLPADGQLRLRLLQLN